MSNASSTGLEKGVVLDGRYRLEEVIGDGGMGQVWQAEHLGLGHKVAIKVLHGHIVRDEEPRRRFSQEARLMAQLGDMSRHITRVLEHGMLEDGVPYLVMERLRGEGLDALLKREKVLTLEQTYDLIKQLCKALAVTHTEGIIHRDLKPANIFLCPEDGGTFVKLLDFGVAKLISDVTDNTSEGQVIGTPNYMSPEQLSTEAIIDHRADLFALGSIVYRCVTGKVAFGKGSVSELAERILSHHPAPPSSINPALPQGFDDFMAKALAKAPEARFQSARELSEALHRLTHEPGSLLPAHVERRPPSVRPPAPKRGAFWATFLLVAAVGGLGVVLVVKGDDKAAKATPSVQPSARPTAIAASTPTQAGPRGDRAALTAGGTPSAPGLPPSATPPSPSAGPAASGAQASSASAPSTAPSASP